MKNMVTDEMTVVFHLSRILGAGLAGSAGPGSLDSISTCQDSPRAEGLCLFCSTPSYPLVFPIDGPRYPFTCFLLLDAPHVLTPLYQEGLFPPRIRLLVL